MTPGFSLKNFYHPARASVQQWGALLKIAGGVLSAISIYDLVPPPYKLACFIGGLVVCAVAEGLEKLTAAPPPAAAPDPATDLSATPDQ